MFGRPPLTMDAVLATIFDGGRAIHIKLIKQLFYRFIQNQAQALLPSPSWIGSLHWIGQIYTTHAVGAAKGSPLWWCLLLSCAGGRWYFPYYSYHRKATDRGYPVKSDRSMLCSLVIHHINKLDGFIEGCLFGVDNQLNCGWYFVFNETFVLICHHLEGDAHFVWFEPLGTRCH